MVEVKVLPLHYNPYTGEMYWTHRAKRNKGRLAGTTTKDGYRAINLSGRQTYLHQIAWAMYHGRWPDLPLDHRNRVKSDNRISNLRLASYTANASNVETKTSQPYRGIWSYDKGKTYYARIKHHGKQIQVGPFQTPEEARDEYERLATKYKGEYKFATL